MDSSEKDPNKSKGRLITTELNRLKNLSRNYDQAQVVEVFEEQWKDSKKREGLT